MNKNSIHSNIPAFTKNESNTKPVLYRHPKPSEMGRKPFAQLLADLRDFVIFIILAVFCWFMVSAVIYTLGA